MSSAISSAGIGATVETGELSDGSVTYAKIQNVSATDKLLGRSTAGAGVVEEIPLTAAGRAILDDADATAQRATLGLVIGTDVQAFDADLSAIAALSSAANKLPYATGAQTWALTDITAAGRALLDDVDAAAQRVTLGSAGLGIPPIVASVTLTAQAAAITTTNLLTAPTAGTYRVTLYHEITQAASVSSATQLTIAWTAAAPQSTAETNLNTNVVGANVRASRAIKITSGDLTYETTYSSSGGTPMQYALTLVVEQLS